MRWVGREGKFESQFLPSSLNPSQVYQSRFIQKKGVAKEIEEVGEKEGCRGREGYL